MIPKRGLNFVTKRILHSSLLGGGGLNPLSHPDPMTLTNLMPNDWGLLQNETTEQ